MQLNLVGAKTGYLWFRQGLWLFRRNPIGLLLLMLTASFALLLLTVIPVLGSAAFFVLLPAVMVAFMIACRDVVLGRPVNPTVLAAGFHLYGKRVARSLLILGVICALACALLFALVAWVGNGAFFDLVLSDNAPSDATLAGANLGVPLATLWLGAVPILMLFWFSPVLIAWHDVPPLKAMFFSFVACSRNWAALLVLYLLWLGVGLASLLLLSLVVSMLDLSWQVLSAAVIPLETLWATALLCSAYATYRGSFKAPDDGAGTAPRSP